MSIDAGPGTIDPVDGLTEPLADLEARIDSGLPPAELIDIITALENSKRAHAALQARATASYATQVRDAEKNHDKTSAAISREIALARECSPHTGGTWLGVADALTTEMPHTVQALRDGRICELTARDVVAQTSHVSAEHRTVVEATLTWEFRRAGATRRAIGGSARTLLENPDEERTESQIRADLLPERVTGTRSPPTRFPSKSSSS